MAAGKLGATEVEATVITMEWISVLDGCMYRGFHGRVTVLSAEDAVGFVPTGHNSANWIARIAGDTTTVTLMGCQVRAIVEGAAPTSREFQIVP